MVACFYEWLPIACIEIWDLIWDLEQIVWHFCTRYFIWDLAHHWRSLSRRRKQTKSSFVFFVYKPRFNRPYRKHWTMAILWYHANCRKGWESSIKPSGAISVLATGWSVKCTPGTGPPRSARVYTVYTSFVMLELEPPRIRTELMSLQSGCPAYLT